LGLANSSEILMHQPSGFPSDPSQTKAVALRGQKVHPAIQTLFKYWWPAKDKMEMVLPRQIFQIMTCREMVGLNPFIITNDTYAQELYRTVRKQTNCFLLL